MTNSTLEWSRCRRCGRLLTDPESVQAGRGPECREQTKVTRRERLTQMCERIAAAMDELSELEARNAGKAVGQVAARLNAARPISRSLETRLAWWHTRIESRERLYYARQFASDNPHLVDDYSDADPGL